METRSLPDRYDAIAPDGSEIRLLPATERGSMVHCTLPPGGISKAVAHRTVEEIWFFLEGEGQVWRSRNGVAEITDVQPGVGLTIPLGTHFQFRNVGDAPLRFLIVTMPPWPGEAEAYRVPDHWPAA
jgi:mannose-6-phosphate isomerase-like protein (cupin superfamily)